MWNGLWANCLRRALRARVFVILALASAISYRGIEQAQAQQASPGEVLDRFCKLDAEGRQLTAAGAKELTPLLAEPKPWAPYAEFAVIKDYKVRAPAGRDESVRVAIEYNVWGRLDPSSLQFVPLAVPSENRPTLIPESIIVMRSNGHSGPGSTEGVHDVSAASEWKITRVPSEPHISLETAARYVNEMRYKSREPLVRVNAQRTLAELQRLSQMQFLSATRPESSQESAITVLSQFAALQTAGTGLTLDSVKQLQRFFIVPPSWRLDKIHVEREFAVSNEVFRGNKGTLYVEYTAVGDLDSSLRITSGIPSGHRVRENYALVLSNRYSLRGAHGEPPQEIFGPSRWMIEDSTGEQWISVNAAINYVTDMRDKTTDPAVQQNANQTLAKLMNLR